MEDFKAILEAEIRKVDKKLEEAQFNLEQSSAAWAAERVQRYVELKLALEKARDLLK